MISAKLQSKINKIQDLRRRSHWKKAYKEAQFCCRLHNEPELQELLVSSLWEWTKELFNRNQHEDAKNNIKELSRLTKNLSSHCEQIQQEFPPIFRVLGLNTALPEHLRQNMCLPEIQTELIDRFLVRGENSNDLLPELREQAMLVQKALEKIEQKLDNEALELLQPIAFHSPLSEWRLFLRGLISYYHKNDEKANESWKRLSTSRPPHQIVHRLQQFLTEKPNTTTSGFVFNQPQTNSPQLQKIEFLNHLRQLDHYIRQKKYKELVGHFQVSRSFLQKTEPLLFERVFRTVHSILVEEANPDIVRQFIERNKPLPFDPHGNRTLGLIALGHGNTDCQRPRWLQDATHYLEIFATHDINQIESLTPSMNARAKAVIYSLLGNIVMQGELYYDGLFYDKPESDVRERISQYFNKALDHDPTYLPTYFRLKEFCRADIPEYENTLYHPRIADIYRKLISHIPDNIEALNYLFRYHIAERNSTAALPYFERLKTLEPLSRETVFLQRQLQYVRLTELLQSHQEQSEIEKLFEEIENTNLNTLESNYDLLLLALKYIYKIISNRPSQAEKVLTQIEKIGLEKRLPLILAIFWEVENFPQFPKHILQTFRQEWNSSITGRCNGNTAGALGNLAYGIMVGKKTFTDSQQIFEQIFDFINRAGQVKWKTEKDLYGTCKILWYLAVKLKKQDYNTMYKKIVQKGLAQFPLSPYFLFFDAELFFLESKESQRVFKYTAIEKYQAFIERCNYFRNDPILKFYLEEAKLRFDDIDCISDGFRPSFDDESPFDTDWDNDDVDVSKILNRAFLPSLEMQEIWDKITPEDITPELKQQILNALPPNFSIVREFMVDAMFECIAQGISIEQYEKYLTEKVEKLSRFEQMRLIASMFKDSGLSPNENEEDENNNNDESFFHKHNKNTKK